jgi:MFS family permease
VTRRRHLADALARSDFRRLIAVRLAGQFGDGLFQASLAGSVLFNPERQANAADVAAGFAVLLLPYSAVGPFAGVLLDRWWRQRVLTLVNVVRAAAVLGVAAEVAGGVDGVPFYASALVVLSMSRFLLSALSASLPHVVDPAELVTANAFSATAGTVCAALGGGVAIGLRSLIGTTDGNYAAIAAATVVPYLLAAAVARRFGRRDLGPTVEERRGRETPAEVVHGLVAGAHHVRRTRPVAAALLTLTAHRLGYGIWTVCTLLLYRNYFHDDHLLRAGLGGLGQVVVMVALGGALAALVTPAAFRRWGPVRWSAGILVVSAAGEAALGLAFRLSCALAAALVLSFGAQALKITVDTLVQREIDDRFRGRVFALYDMLFNLALVLAAVITATALPADGHSAVAVTAIAVGWLLAAAAYVTSSRRTSG